MRDPRVDDPRLQIGDLTVRSVGWGPILASGRRTKDHFGLSEDLGGVRIEDEPMTEPEVPAPADCVAATPGDIGHIALEADARYFSESIEGSRA